MTSKPAASANQSVDEALEKSINVIDALTHLGCQMEAIEKFIRRRFDEISMEINATSQQVDMAEEGIGRRFGEIVDVMKAISYSGDGTTPANTGVELDAVVSITEEAATRIMDAADRISQKVETLETSGGDQSKEQSIAGIRSDIEEIFMACSFQDVTGQRIRKTLENLRLVEERLSTALGKMGIEAPTAPAPLQSGATQDDIDCLFGGD